MPQIPSNLALDAIMDEPVTANADLDAIMAAPTPRSPVGQAMTRWDVALEMLQTMPGPQAAPETFIETMHTTAGRGVFHAFRQMGGLQRTGAGVVDSVIGENFFSEILAEKGKQAQFMGELGLKMLPRHKESEGFFEKTAGNILESGPSTAIPIAAGFLAGPAGPAVAFAIFAGTAAAPVVGAQYLEALAAGRTEGEAEIEALVAGGITAATQWIPFQFILKKIPYADRLLDTAVRRWAFRFVGGGVSEGGQEIMEGIGIEMAKAILRDDPEIAFGLLTNEFWGPMIEEAITAAIVGGSLGGSISAHEEINAKIAEGKHLTREDVRLAHQTILLTLPDSAADSARAPGQVSTSVDLVGEPIQPGDPEAISLVKATQIPKIKLTKTQSAELDATAVGTLKRFGIDAGGGAIPLDSMNSLTQDQREELADALEQDNDPADGLEDRSGPLRRSMAGLISKLREGVAEVEAADVAPEAAVEPPLDVKSELASIDDSLLPEAEDAAQLIRSGTLGNDAQRNADAVLGEVQRRLDDQAAASEPTPPPPPAAKPKVKESVADLIRRIVWGGPYRVETVTEAEELIREIRDLKKLGREAIKKARIEGADAATRVWEDRLFRAKNRAGEVDALKAELFEALNERFGGKIPANLAKKLNKVRTRKQLDNAIDTAERLVRRLERTEAIGRVKTAVRSVRRGHIAPDIQAAVDDLLSDINVVSLSEPLREVLRGIRAATEGLGPPVVTAAQLAAVRDFIIENEGVTYEPFGGSFDDSGYVVSRYPQREQALPPGVPVTSEMIDAFMKRNADIFANNPRARLGGWYDKATRQWVLDIAEIHENSEVGKQEALDVGRQAAQKAIFHLDSFTEISVFGSDAEFNAARSAVDLAASSDVAADSRPDERDRAEVALPKRLEDQLARLDRVNIKDLETSDIQHLAEMLSGLLGKNGRRAAARRSARAQALERAADVMASEIDGRIRSAPGAIIPTQQKRKGLRPLRVNRQGRQEPDKPGKFAGLVEVAVGRIPNLLPSTLSEYLGGQDSGTFEILYGDVNRGMDRAYDLEFQFIDMWEAGLKDLRVGDSILRKISVRIATASNIFKTAAQSVGFEPFGESSADIITYKLSNGQTMKMDRDERMYLLNLLRRRIVFEDIVFRGTTIKLRANPSKAIRLTASDVRIIQGTSPGVNSHGTDNAIAALMFDIVNGPARQAMSKWSIDNRGWDITAGEAAYWMSRREHQELLEPTSSSGKPVPFTRRTMHQLSILKPKTEGADNSYLIGSMIQEGRRYLKQVAMLTQVGPELDMAGKALNSKPVQDVLRNLKGGKRITQRFNDTYEMMAADAGVGLPAEGPTETVVGGLLANATIGALGLNIWVPLYQPLSLIVAGLFQNPVHLTRAIASGAAVDFRIDKRAKQYGFMRHRNYGSNLGLVQEGGTLGTQLLGKRDGLREKFMAMIRALDLGAIRVIWRAAEYEGGIKPQDDGLLNDSDLNFVKEIVGPTVKMSQPTFDTLHLSWAGVEGKKNPVSKLAFGMFRAQLAKQINMYHQFAMRGQWGKLSIAMIVSNVLISLIRDLRDTVVRGKKSDVPWHLRILRGAGSALLGQPIFGGFIVFFADMLAGFRGYEPSNVATGMVMDIGNASVRLRASWIKNGFQSEETQRALVEWFVASTTFGGLPMRSLWKDLSPWFWPKPPEGKKRKGF